MKVRNMRSTKGNDVANQFVIIDGNKTIFQSYNSTIAIVENNTITLGVDWDYSKTTMKYLSMFLNEHTYLEYPCNKKVIEKAIREGKIIYDERLR